MPELFELTQHNILKPGLFSSGFFYAINFSTMFKTIIIENRKVLYSKDKYSGMYTMSLLEKGGPIICGRDFNKVKEDFENALGLAISTRKLLNFERDGKF